MVREPAPGNATPGTSIGLPDERPSGLYGCDPQPLAGSDPLPGTDLQVTEQIMTTATATPTEAQREFRTDDLALATYLRMNSVEEARLEMKDGRREIAEWVYGETSGLIELLAVYEKAEARVEPLEFMKCLWRVRGAMYTFVRASRG